ncbi:MAG: SOS response-associated peptidase [SAR324 cluster bacterium]|nr:SOS response-associated peptidase [SAR324 cluster bacterium]
MCGRFALYEKLEKLKEEFPQVFFPQSLGNNQAENHLPEGNKLEPRYNISPGTKVLGIAGNSQGMKAGFFHWGLVPAWADNAKTSYKMTNARAETLGTKKSYHRAFEQRRCVILANGFFEWLRADSGKAPYFIGLPNHSLFAMAAVWERWLGPVAESEQPQELISTSIITTEASDQMAPIHHRMPILLRPQQIQAWLYEGYQHPEEILKPYSGQLEIFPVSARVNSSRNHGPDLINPLCL